MYQIVVFLLGHLHFFLHFSSRSWRTFLRNPLYHIGVFAVFFLENELWTDGRRDGWWERRMEVPTDGGTDGWMDWLTDGGSDGCRYQRMEVPTDG